MKTSQKYENKTHITRWIIIVNIFAIRTTKRNNSEMVFVAYNMDLLN